MSIFTYKFVYLGLSLKTQKWGCHFLERPKMATLQKKLLFFLRFKISRWQESTCTNKIIFIFLFFFLCLDIKIMISRQSNKKQTPMWQGTLYKWLYESMHTMLVWVNELRNSRVGQIFESLLAHFYFFLIRVLHRKAWLNWLSPIKNSWRYNTYN